MHMSPIRSAGLAAALLLPSALPAQQQDFSQVEVTATQLADRLYMLEGSGGNIGVSVGPDGVVLIDDQFAPLTAKIQAAVSALSDQPIRFVINTHYHGDHTGGNQNLARAGALIFAQDNVRKRLAEGVAARNVAPSPPEALPVVTFSSELTMHLNGEELFAFRVDPAHTDGDTMIWFRKANLIHTGDVFRTNGYPVADTDAGGSVLGILRVYERLHGLMGPDTRLLPGHGRISTREDLAAQIDMLSTIRDRVAAQKRAGRSLAEVQAMKLTANSDEVWGKGRTTGDLLVQAFYNELP